MSLFTSPSSLPALDPEVIVAARGPRDELSGQNFQGETLQGGKGAFVREMEEVGAGLLIPFPGFTLTWALNQKQL